MIGYSPLDKNMETVPPPVLYPVPNTITVDRGTLVYFDLETTGFGRDSHITQIAAVGPQGSYSRYVLPKKPIHISASQVTGLYLIGDKLCHNTTKLDAVDIRTALNQFFEFIGEKCVLIGHNAKNFDCHVLLNAAAACGMCTKLDNAVGGFVDSLLVFKHAHPQQYSYTLENLYNSLMGKSYSGAHGALEDVCALKTMFDQCVHVHLTPFSFTLEYICSVMEYIKNRKENYTEWDTLVQQKVWSKGMAEKAAGSGLKYSIVKLVFERCGSEGVVMLLGEKLASGGARVTKNKRVLNSLISYMSGIPTLQTANVQSDIISV